MEPIAIPDTPRRPGAEFYTGILVELELSEEGTVDLVMVPQGTPLESWGDPMKQFIFHAAPGTIFSTPPEELPEGALLNIRHKGIVTFSIPPQGVACEVAAAERRAAEVTL